MTRRFQARVVPPKGLAVNVWTPNSWTTHDLGQSVAYPDEAKLRATMDEIARLPPLVTSWEIEALRSQLALASSGRAFLLQGGDCAESFDDCRADSVEVKIKILLQMSLLLVHGTRKPVIRMGRIAGQYAKPRSSAVEVREGVSLPSYRGDIINRMGFSADDREPRPERLLRGYERAALTLNYVRALVDSGFADLHHPENWDISFANGSEHIEEYERIVEGIRSSISFMESVTGRPSSRLDRVEFYTSHEALSLHYEQAQTRSVPRKSGHYNLSTHMPWIGARTAELRGAHVEYCRGIQNPVGLKVSPSVTPEQLVALVEVLNPHNVPGKLVLIHRMGVGNVERMLPPLVETLRRRGDHVVWVCDPMHGNTEVTADGIKTRRFENILGELQRSFEVHASLGSVLGGVHFELTGEDVTECIGGSSGIEESDLHRDYRSKVDPRLNYEQALEMALLVTRHLRSTP